MTTPYSLFAAAIAAIPVPTRARNRAAALIRNSHGA